MTAEDTEIVFSKAEGACLLDFLDIEPVLYIPVSTPSQRRRLPRDLVAVVPRYGTVAGVKTFLFQHQFAYLAGGSQQPVEALHQIREVYIF